MTDRLRVNKLAPKIASWVASAMLRRVELCDDNLVIPHALAARAAVLAFGDAGAAALSEALNADVAQVSRAHLALCQRPCLATSIPDPPLLAAA